MKTLKNVSTEMALHVLAYNMKRVMSILGVGGLMGGEGSVIARRWTDQTMDFWRSGGNMFPRQRR